MGTTPPPEYEQFLVEQAFWKELGISGGRPLAELPWRQVEDYALFISMIRREEAARQAAANRRR
jgi:hypothetical protein